MSGPRELALITLQYAPPGTTPQNIGVFLLDASEDSLHIQMRENWNGFPEQDLHTLAVLAEDLVLIARELGAVKLIEYLEGSLSNRFRFSAREVIKTHDVDATLHEMFNTRCCN